MLAGLSALAIPVLIHLLMRRKKLRLRFSTLQFFLKQDEKSGRRHKLHQWLLLSTRLLLLSLIVLAFARPHQNSKAPIAGNRQRQNIVFILDRTASMQARDGDATRWAQAKEAIGRSLDALDDNDRAAIVTCSTRSATAFAFMPPSTLKSQLDKIPPGYGRGDLGEAIDEAAKLLSTTGGTGKPGICVVSDLQQQSCRKLDVASLPRQVELKVLPVGGGELPNQAIMDLKLDAENNRSMKAEAADFSDSEAARRTALRWTIDGKDQPPSTVSLIPQTNAIAALPLPALSPGWHRVEAHLDIEDAFPGDNARYQVLQVATPSRTLCIESRNPPHRFQEESFFVANALQPGFSTTNAPPALFQVDTVGPADAPSVLSLPEKLSQYKLILMPALNQIPGGAENALLQFVEHGGAVVFWMGDDMNAGLYNSKLGKLLPAVLGQRDGDIFSLENWHLGEVNFQSPAFAIFHQSGNGDVSLPEFTRRFGLEPAAGSEVIARFNDAVPFLVTREIGAGRVALINTSMDTAWSDWPKRKTFVPWIHSLCHYLTRTEAGAAIQSGRTYVADAVADIETDPADAGKPLQVHPPRGDDLTVVPDAQGKFSIRFSVPGIYTVLDPKGGVSRLLAANLPQNESDLSALTATEFEQQIVRNDDRPAKGPMAGLLNSENDERGFWRVLLLGAAALLLLEIGLANRTFA